MKRLLLVSILSVACSRASRPAARPAATPAPASAAVSAAATPHDEHEEEEQRAIVNAARALSSFDDSAEGAKGFVGALAEAARGHDHERQERFEDELVADRARFELALTFEGARQLRDRVLPTIEPGARALQTRLASLREPLTVVATSALGSELADGQSHGFGSGVVSARQHLRPTVRFFRVDVTGADGQRVTLEPMAYLGGRWTWLGELAAPVTPAPTTPPVAPTTPAAAR